MKNNWLNLYKASETRETYTPEINPELDVAITMVCQMKGLKKEAVINNLAAEWVNTQIDSMNVKDLSAYSKEKKQDNESKQLARLVAMEKIFGATDEEEEGDRNDKNCDEHSEPA